MWEGEGLISLLFQKGRGGRLERERGLIQEVEGLHGGFTLFIVSFYSTESRHLDGIGNEEVIPQTSNGQGKSTSRNLILSVNLKR